MSWDTNQNNRRFTWFLQRVRHIFHLFLHSGLCHLPTHGAKHCIWSAKRPWQLHKAGHPSLCPGHSSSALPFPTPLCRWPHCAPALSERHSHQEWRSSEKRSAAYAWRHHWYGTELPVSVQGSLGLGTQGESGTQKRQADCNMCNIFTVFFSVC